MGERTIGNWQLIRCRYDEMDMAENEVENPVPRREFNSYCIGIIIEDSADRKLCRVVLEGNKEDLEYVLKLKAIIKRIEGCFLKT